MASRARRRRGNPGRRSIHTARFDRCVKDVGRSARNPYAVCEAELGEARAIRKGHRRRRSNPKRRARVVRQWVLIAVPKGKGNPVRPLYYTGNRFSAKGRSETVKFASRGQAAEFGRGLVGLYASLRDYTVRAVPF